MLKRILSLFSACAVLFFASVPALATGMEMFAGVPVVGEIELDVVEFADFICRGGTWFYNAVAHGLGSDICAYAPTVGGRHSFKPVRTLVNGEVGLYYQCEYCHKNYGDELSEAYEGYMEDLPSAQYSSDGSFIWAPGPADFTNLSDDNMTFSYSPRWSAGTGYIRFKADGSSRFNASLSESGGSVSAWAVPYEAIYLLQGSGSWWYDFSSLSFQVPIDANYTPLVSAFSSCSRGSYGAGATLSTGVVRSNASEIIIPWPSFKVTPFVAYSGFAGDTRVSGAAFDGGSFGYIRDGQVIQSSVGTIFDESSNIYNNPVTGDTSVVSSWVYDYSDRSYNLTMSNGDEISVVYGDTSVVINQGGTAYSVLYLVEEPEDVQTHIYTAEITTQPTCVATGVRTYVCSECGDEYTEAVPALGHDYVSEITTQPTCVATGVRRLTCSRCGDVRVESIPATGHTWEAVSVLPTQYDSVTGELLQEGFAIYQCSVCAEQYRIDSASGGSALPSPSSGGVSAGDGSASIEVPASESDAGSDVGSGLLPSIAQGVTRDLPEALEALSGWFAFFPDYYGGWAAFLRDGVSCLPREAQIMISFGFGAIVFLGILFRVAGRR